MGRRAAGPPAGEGSTGAGFDDPFSLLIDHFVFLFLISFLDMFMFVMYASKDNGLIFVHGKNVGK